MGNDTTTVSLFMGLSILSEVGYLILSFVVRKNKWDRIRISLVSAIYIAAAIVAFISSTKGLLFYISTFLIIIAMAINQLLQIGRDNNNKIGDLTKLLLGLTLIGLSVAILVNIYEEQAHYIALVTVVLLLFNCLKKLLAPTFSFEKIRLLVDILIKTHTFDVLICLLAFIIAFSFVFPIVEPTLTNFWDSMWYCFAVITTIGFGDFSATTAVGRVLTVILGIYGIVVVAILTSVVVNFYNEISSKEKKRKFIEK